MKGSRILEKATTKWLAPSAFLAVCGAIGAFAGLILLDVVEAEDLQAFADIALKVAALLVGGLWALNRYFVQRTDAIQIRVDPSVNYLRLPTQDSEERTSPGLLIYRLEVVNTGKSFIPAYKQFVQLSAVRLHEHGLSLEPLHRWPEIGFHEGGPIEPGSWSAIDDAISVSQDLVAMQLYLEVHLSGGQVWTWHRTWALQEGYSNVQ